MELNTVQMMAVIGFATIALVTDLKRRRIPNWLTVTATVLGISWNLSEQGTAGLLMSLGGFATGFGILLVLWLIGGGGGGDVKLMGAVGAWLGAMPTLVVFIVSTGFAVICTITMVTWNRLQSSSTDEPVADEEQSAQPIAKVTVPYAVPVAMSIWSLFVLHLF